MQIDPISSKTRRDHAVLRIARHLAVASLSLLVIASSVAYVFSPIEEALAAKAATVASTAHHEAIDGKVQSKYAVHGVVVRVLEQEHGRNVPIATVRLDRNGRFHIPVHPGHYKVVIKHGDDRLTERVSVTRGHSEFIVVVVSKTRGGLGIAPVIFNY